MRTPLVTCFALMASLCLLPGPIRLLAADGHPDSDNDGMPDEWEQKHDCDPHDPSDAALDYDLDGYTNLEEFNAGTDPGRDVLGHTATGNSAPILKWTTVEMLEVLDKLAQHRGARFEEVLQYRRALGSTADNAALEDALQGAYRGGTNALKQHGDLPRGFLASLRARPTEGQRDFSDLLASTNAAVQRVMLTSMAHRGATAEEAKSLVQNFERLDRQSKHMALSVLLRNQTPEVQSFLEQVDDPAISNRVHAVLQRSKQSQQEQSPYNTDRNDGR